MRSLNPWIKIIFKFSIKSSHSVPCSTSCCVVIVSCPEPAIAGEQWLHTHTYAGAFVVGLISLWPCPYQIIIALFHSLGRRRPWFSSSSVSQTDSLSKLPSSIGRWPVLSAFGATWSAWLRCECVQDQVRCQVDGRRIRDCSVRCCVKSGRCTFPYYYFIRHCALANRIPESVCRRETRPYQCTATHR